MNLLEVWRGTPKERQQIAAKNKLQQRLGNNQRLSEAQKRTYEEGSILSKKLTRRRFIAASAATVALTATGAITWEMSKGNSEELSTSIDSIESWKALPAIERLHRLWDNHFPELEGLDSLSETVLASAELFVSQASSKFTPQELASRTILVNKRYEFADLKVKDTTQNDPSRQLDREGIAKETTGFTTLDRSKVFINMEAIEGEAHPFYENPQISQEIKKSNVFAKLLSKTLLHEYGHINAGRNTVTIDQPIDINFTDGAISIVGIEGLNLKAIFDRKSGSKEAEIKTEEVFVETQGLELGKQAGDNTLPFLSNSYRFGSDWVSKLNRSANIEFTEFTKYIAGDLPLADLLQKWGSLSGQRDENQQLTIGIRILAMIGLQSNEDINDAPGVSSYINSLLLPSSQTAPAMATPMR